MILLLFSDRFFHLFCQASRSASTLWRLEKIEIKIKFKNSIQKYRNFQEPLKESEIRACLKNRLTGTSKKFFLIQRWTLGQERPISVLALRRKSCVYLATPRLTLPPVETHFSFTFDTRQTFFPSLLANSAHVRLSLQQPILKTPSGHDHTEFGHINHWKWRVHFNALFGRRNCSLIV